MAETVCVVAATALLSVNAVTDIRKREVLPLFSLFLGAAGFLWRILALNTPLLFLTAAFLPGLALLALSRISRGAVGAGDGLVVTALGGWTSVAECFFSVVISLTLVAVAAAVLFILGRRKKSFPYIPFLLAGYGLTFVF